MHTETRENGVLCIEWDIKRDEELKQTKADLSILSYIQPLQHKLLSPTFITSESNNKAIQQRWPLLKG